MVAAILAQAAVGRSEGEIREELGDTRPEVRVRLELSEPVPDVQVRWSSRTDDVDCERVDMLSSGPAHEYAESLKRLAAPQRALYEWHLCFVVRGNVYRGWRGYDPGPNGEVHLLCRLDPTTDPGDTYACSLSELSVDERNYSEYALSCGGDRCLRFESAEDYSASEESPAIRESDRLEIAVALIRKQLEKDDSYLKLSPMSYVVSVEGADLSPDQLADLSSDLHHFFVEGEMTVPLDDLSSRRARLSFSGFERRRDGQVRVRISIFCGSLCGSLQKGVVHRTADGSWAVDSVELVEVY